MTEREKMLAGELYRASDAELSALRARAQRLMRDYNATVDEDAEARTPILNALLGQVGPECEIRAPFYVDYGCHITLGSRVFLNYDCVFLDVCQIDVGEGTQIGSAVQVVTADHPRDPEVRASGLECGKPIVIGRNVWIGSGALILPGVTVGDGAIVGAGAVVTRDVSPGMTVMGNPARPTRSAEPTTPSEGT